MKVVAREIDIFSWTDTKGEIRPVKLKLEDKGKVKELNIDRVIKVDREKQAGKEMLVYTCQSEIKGIQRPFELKYDLKTCKWILFKI